jgi:hypothetical protein
MHQRLSASLPNVIQKRDVNVKGILMRSQNNERRDKAFAKVAGKAAIQQPQPTTQHESTGSVDQSHR